MIKISSELFMYKYSMRIVIIVIKNTENIEKDFTFEAVFALWSIFNSFFRDVRHRHLVFSDKVKTSQF